MKPLWLLWVFALVWSGVSGGISFVAGWPNVISPLGIGFAVASLVLAIARLMVDPETEFEWSWLLASVLLLIIAGLLSLFQIPATLAFIVALAVTYTMALPAEVAEIGKIAATLLAFAVLVLVAILSLPIFSLGEAQVTVLVPVAYLFSRLALEGAVAWQKGDFKVSTA